MAMNAEQARQLVIRLYAFRVDRNGLPELDHLYAVAHHAPSDCQVVALLHDVLEDGLLTTNDLLSLGVTGSDFSAIVLLTRAFEPGGRSEKTYAQYIGTIAQANGEAGRKARAVKQADVTSNLLRKGSISEDRYARALKRIHQARAERGELGPDELQPIRSV